MVPLLRTEANDVTLTVWLVSEQMLTRNHRMQYKKLHDKLYEIWDRYENEDEYTTSSQAT
ncbi:hypothetical protein DPMN_094474 [Dreissena polymorpha]|uniref:Uncharacterized protein n=1 Tax=Dreissena polymorpha TaxID=45954 RepID=A0A9D4R3K2_DREPO|nr:hypothetical protein DPMN_094474 [Dreissena polymorpha]